MKDRVGSKIPRSTWISLGTWTVALVLCLLLWFLRTGQDYRKLRDVKESLDETSSRLLQMERDIASQPQLGLKAAEVGSRLHSITNEHVLTPTLSSSYAVTAKFLIEPMAEAAGFYITETAEKYRVPLPVARQNSKLHFDRIGITVNGRGSYFALAGFIAAVEENLPYAAVAGFKVVGQRGNPLEHEVEVLLEWPVQGVPPPPPPKPKKRRSS